MYLHVVQCILYSDLLFYIYIFAYIHISYSGCLSTANPVHPDTSLSSLVFIVIGSVLAFIFVVSVIIAVSVMKIQKWVYCNIFYEYTYFILAVCISNGHIIYNKYPGRTIKKSFAKVNHRKTTDEIIAVNPGQDTLTIQTRQNFTFQELSAILWGRLGLLKINDIIKSNDNNYKDMYNTNFRCTNVQM